MVGVLVVAVSSNRPSWRSLVSWSLVDVAGVFLSASLAADALVVLLLTGGRGNTALGGTGCRRFAGGLEIDGPDFRFCGLEGSESGVWSVE